MNSYRFALFAALVGLSGCTKKFADNIPEGCPDDNALTITSEEVTEFKIEHAWYTTWRGIEGSLVFASYAEFDPAKIYDHRVTDKEARVVIKLKNADGSPVGKGRYKATYRQDPKPVHQVPEFNISTPGLAGGVFDPKGTVDITYFGDDFACGTIRAEDRRSKIVGKFITHYNKVN